MVKKNKYKLELHNSDNEFIGSVVSVGYIFGKTGEGFEVFSENGNFFYQITPPVGVCGLADRQPITDANWDQFQETLMGWYGGKEQDKVDLLSKTDKAMRNEQ